MDKIKISALGSLDEIKYKKIQAEREAWIDDGTDMLINSNFGLHKIVKSLHMNRVATVVKDIKNENNKCRTITLASKTSKKLALFKPGQYIIVSAIVDGKFITRPYTITSDLKQARDGEYSIAVFKEENGIMSNYLVDDLKIGDELVISGPFGDFYYNSIRDKKNVISLASGRGITPFYAMAKAVVAGELDISLNILYSCKFEKDLVFKEELKNFADLTSKINVCFILSDEEKEGCVSGFASLDKIKTYMTEENSFFICGSEGFLKYLNKELESLKLPRKYIRYEDYLPKCNVKKVKEFKLVVNINGETKICRCFNNKTILEAIEQSGLYIPSKCHTGKCGWCSSLLIRGKVKVVNDKRREAEKKYNYIHPCSTYPLSDVEITVR